MTRGTAAGRMLGSSIVAPGGASWATGFLNAAFYRRPREERSVEELRLAHCILGTAWWRRGRRLGARERGAFHRAFGGRRPLDRDALMEGASEMFGHWFPEAWEDPARRAHGLAFPTPQARLAFDPSSRLVRGGLRELTPPRRPPERQVWATYPPVPLPEPRAAAAFLEDPARWPDMSSAAGRFTAVGPGGLAGQTFEIHLALHPGPRALFATRGYVTCTALHLGGDGLRRAFEHVRDHAEVPEGANPMAFIELTTHKGHFMGRGISRLLVYEAGGSAFVCDVGSWDRMSPLLAAGYAAGGHEAQVAFWGPDDPESGMLAQLALVTAVDPDEFRSSLG